MVLVSAQWQRKTSGSTFYLQVQRIACARRNCLIVILCLSSKARELSYKCVHIQSDTIAVAFATLLSNFNIPKLSRGRTKRTPRPRGEKYMPARHEGVRND